MYILYIISIGTPPVCTSDVNEQFSLLYYFSSQHKLVIYSMCNKGISILENFDCNRVKYVRLEKRTTTMHSQVLLLVNNDLSLLVRCLNGSYLVGRSVVCTKHKTQFYVSNQKTLVLYFVVTRTTSVLPCGHTQHARITWIWFLKRMTIRQKKRFIYCAIGEIPSSLMAPVVKQHITWTCSTFYVYVDHKFDSFLLCCFFCFLVFVFH